MKIPDQVKMLHLMRLMIFLFILISSGSVAAKTINGTAGNDVLQASGTNDIVDGGSGIDTYVLNVSRSDAILTTLAGITRIHSAHQFARFSKISLRNIEEIRFSDESVTLETSSKNQIVAEGINPIEGTAADDVFEALGNSTRIDGHQGDDTFIIFAESSGFQVSTIEGITQVTGRSENAQETRGNIKIELINVERLIFTNEEIALEVQDINLNYSDQGDATDEHFLRTLGLEIKGGGGTDALVLFAPSSIYTVTTLEGVTQIATDESILWLPKTIYTSGIERLVFSDKTVTLATDGRGFSTEGSSNDDVIHTIYQSRVAGLSGKDILVVFGPVDGFDIETVSGVSRLTANSRNTNPRYSGRKFSLSSVEQLVFTDGRVDLPSKPEVVIPLDRSTYDSLENDESPATKTNDVFELVDHYYSERIVLDGLSGSDLLVVFDDIGYLETISGLTSLKTRNGPRWLSNIEQLATPESIQTLETISSQYLFPTQEGDGGTNGDDLIVFWRQFGTIDGGSGNDALLIFGKAADYSVASAGGLVSLEAVSDYNSFKTVLLNVAELRFVDETISLSEGPVTNVIFDVSTRGVETIVGGAEDETFWLRGGDDILFGGSGKDTLSMFANKDEARIDSAGPFTRILVNRDEIYISEIETIAFQDGSISLVGTSTGVSELILPNTFRSPNALGTESDDFIVLGSKGYTYFGEGGDDTLLVFSSFSESSYQTLAGVTKLTPPSPTSSGRVTYLSGIEKITFVDRSVSLATTSKTSIITPLDEYTGDDDDEVIVARGTSDGFIDGAGGQDDIAIYESSSNFTVQTLAGVTRLESKDEYRGEYTFLDTLIVNTELLHFTDRRFPLSAPSVNLISGTRQDNQLIGTAANEVFVGRGGVDRISGGEGVDVAVVFQHSSELEISTIGGQTKIVGQTLGGGTSQITLDSVETVIFLDKEITLTTSSSKVITIQGFPGEQAATDGDDTLSIEEFFGSREFWVDGGNGNDTFLIHDIEQNFSINTIAGVTQLTNLTTARTIVLANIEAIQFSNTLVSLENASPTNLIAGTQKLAGSENSDAFVLSNGADRIDGKAGFDSLIIFGNRNEFVATTHQNLTWISRKHSPDRTFPTIVVTNVEEMQFLDMVVSIPAGEHIINEEHSSFGLTEGTAGNDHISGGGFSSRVDGNAGFDTYYIFSRSSLFDYHTMKGVTQIFNRDTEAFIEYAHDTMTFWQVEEIRFSDKVISLQSGEIDPIRQSNDEQTSGTEADDIFLRRVGTGQFDGGPGNDTLLVFDQSSHYEITTEQGVTTVMPLEGSEGIYGWPATLEHVEQIMFLDDVVKLDTYPRSLDSSAHAYLVTTSSSQNRTEVHIINSSNMEQHIVASLYDVHGGSLGKRNIQITEKPLAPQARLIVNAVDMQKLFGTEPWKGPALLDVRGDEHFEVMSKLRSPSGLVSNTNCSSADSAHNIEGADSDNTSYVRLINTGFRKLSDLRGTLYNAAGEPLGEPDRLLVESLTAKQSIWLTTPQLEDIFGTSWSGVASLEISQPPANLRVLNLNLVENTFFNFSCYQGSEDSSVYLQTSPTGFNTSSTHIVNRSAEPTLLTGTMFASDGSQIGEANSLLSEDPLPANGRLVLDSAGLKRLMGGESWQGPATMRVSSSESIGLMTRLTSPSGLVTNTNCVRKNNVHNIEGFDADSVTYIRVINISDVSVEQVRGTVYDASGEVVGKADAVLVEQLAPNEAVWLNRDDLSAIIGAQWQQEVSLVLQGDDNPNLRLLNLNLVNNETFFNFSCYESGNQPPEVNMAFANKHFVAGQDIAFYLSDTIFSDPDEQLIYSVTGLPPGLTFDGFRKISGNTPVFGIGQYKITITATDAYLNVATSTFLVEIVSDFSINRWTPGTFFDANNYEGKCANPRSGNDPSTGLFFRDVQGTRTDENNWIRSWSEDIYFWYDELPDLDPADYATPEYFDLMKTDARLPYGLQKDRFHFSVKTDGWRSESELGESIGYGISLAILRSLPPRRALIAFVEPGSPASAAGLKRGDNLIEVDGVNFIESNTVRTINDGLFPDSPAQSHRFTFQDRDTGDLKNVTLVSSRVVLTPVQNVKMITTDVGLVGYLQFNDHIATAESQLAEAITTLKAGGIKELVLDLRYNSGGYLSLASQLAYMIADPEDPDQLVFEELFFNDKHTVVNPVTGRVLAPIPFYSSARGFSIDAGTPLPTLGLNRVYVITGEDTCSASESIINGLVGIGVEVLQIGTTTCGKPYGFYAADNCGETYFSIQFKGVNALGYGDYDLGFKPEVSRDPLNPRILKGCSVQDDFDHDLGDPEERRLSTALTLISKGDCSGSQRAKPKLNPIDSLPKTPMLRKPLFLQNRILRRN